MGNSAQRRKDKNRALISGESTLPSQNMQSNEVKKEEDTSPLLKRSGIGPQNLGAVGTVSYTHLTLPTICSV